MAVNPKNIIPRKQAESVQTTQYTAVNCRTIIDKFTVTNTTAGNVLFSINLVAFTDTPGDDNLVLATRSIAGGETYNCPEATGQILEPNDFISTVASASSSLTISASGREITA
jgi:hypothetical protein